MEAGAIVILFKRAPAVSNGIGLPFNESSQETSVAIAASINISESSSGAQGCPHFWMQYFLNTHLSRKPLWAPRHVELVNMTPYGTGAVFCNNEAQNRFMESVQPINLHGRIRPWSWLLSLSYPFITTVMFFFLFKSSSSNKQTWPPSTPDASLRFHCCLRESAAPCRVSAAPRYRKCSPLSY